MSNAVPGLELVCDPEGLVRRVDPRPVDPARLAIGPHDSNAVSTRGNGGSSREFVRLERNFGRERVISCVGSRCGVWLAERLLIRGDEAPLEHGAFFELTTGNVPASYTGGTAGTVFRWLQHAEPPSPPSAQEHEIADNPDDDERWLVWADSLFEKNDPVAPRILQRAPSSAAAEALWLGPLAAPIRRGAMKVRWQRGFLEHASLESTENIWRLPTLMAMLMVAPCARFLRSLTVELGSFHRDGSFGAFAAWAATDVVRQLAAGSPIALRRLSFPGLAASTPELKALWEALRNRAPHLPKNVESTF
jgi:hypothetical protein